MQSKGFSTGFTWMYWDHFKPTDDEEGAAVILGTNHTKKELYSPSPKHGNFKNEILEYPTMTKLLYEKLRVKVQEFMRNSKKVKALKAHFGWSWEQHYGISEGAPVADAHLFAVILYCDYTVLCTKMSETFRALSPEEEVTAVKERNRSFWWMSKKLRELIEVFGDDNRKHFGTPNKIKGPFFCGVSFVASLSSFCISLRGPTSTTKQVDVSINFSGEHGIIITLNNKMYPGSMCKWFNTSWLSAFKEEDERLTIGGRREVQIVSVRNVQTTENFGRFFQPLYWFDFLFGASLVDDSTKPFNDKMVDMICDLMVYAESNDRENTDFPQYILDVFDHWRFQKKRVMIWPMIFQKYYYDVPSKLRNVFFHSMSKGTYPDDTNLRVNLLKQRVLTIFPELEYVKVYDYGSDDQYPFSLSLLMNETLSGLQSVKNGNFQCDVYGKWVSSEYEKLSGDFGPFQLMGIEKDAHGYEYLRIQCV